MNRTIIRTYDSYEVAENVIEQLKSADISSSDISFVGKRDGEDVDNRATEGAGIGAGIGAAAGLLAGLGLMAIPGVGPVVAAGWIASTLTGVVAGATAGGLVGSFISDGVSEEDANYYAETVRRGGTVVSVKTSDQNSARVEAIMDGAAPINRDSRLAEYRQSGWTGFDENATPYSRPVSR